MRTHNHETVRLGDLVVAVFDEAALHSSDPKEVSRLAIQTVRHLLQSAQRTLAPPPPPVAPCKAGSTG